MIRNLHTEMHSRNNTTHAESEIISIYNKINHTTKYLEETTTHSSATSLLIWPMLSGLFTFTEPMHRSLDHATIHTTQTKSKER